MTNEKALAALHDLVATCNDSSEGFGKAAKGVGDMDLSNWLAQASNTRDIFAGELGAMVGKLGGTPRDDLHEGGILHRGWVDLETRIRSKNAHEIVQECVLGETGTLKHYDHALTLEYPEDLRSMLLEQRTAIDDDLTYLQHRIGHHREHHA